MESHIPDPLSSPETGRRSKVRRLAASLTEIVTSLQRGSLRRMVWVTHAPPNHNAGQEEAVFLLAVKLHTDSKTMQFKGIVTQLLHIPVAALYTSINTSLNLIICSLVLYPNFLKILIKVR